MSSFEKKKALAEVSHLQEILRRWDPIGLFSPPFSEYNCPREEYDSYAPHIHTILRQGTSVEKMALHLQRIRTLDMGLHSFLVRDLAIAKELVSWWQAR